MAAYRSSIDPTYVPVARFFKAPAGPSRRQFWTLALPWSVIGAVSAGALVFLLVTGSLGRGDASTFVIFALPILASVLMFSAALGKLRAHRELLVEVSYCSQTGIVRFSSRPSYAVELPARDIVGIRHREDPLAHLQGFRTVHPRVSFALVAQTARAEVAIAAPLVCTGASFIGSARSHLEAELADVAARIALAVRAATAS
jgi:hypothetical protein